MNTVLNSLTEKQRERLDSELEDKEDLDFFVYLMSNGAVNDFDKALKEVQEASWFNDWNEYIQEYYDIPARFWGLIDKEKARIKIEMEVSIVKIGKRYYIQE